MGQGVSFQSDGEEGSSTLLNNDSPRLNNCGQLRFPGAFPEQEEPQGDPETLSEEYTTTTDMGEQRSRRSSLKSEAEGITSNQEEVSPILDKGKQRATSVQDDDARTRVSGCSTSSLVDQFGGLEVRQERSISAANDTQLDGNMTKAARAKAIHDILTRAPLVNNAGVQIASGSKITGAGPVIAGGNVITGGTVSLNIYNTPKDAVNGKCFQHANFHLIQQHNYEKWTNGTLAWFTDSEDYLDWKAGKHRVLWGTGIPGAGKTILAARTIHDLQQLQRTSHQKICVVFAYCRYSAQLSVKDILESLVKQFLKTDPSLADLVKPLYSLHEEKETRPTQEELLELLRQFEERFDVVFYVIDGLDEALVDTQFDLIKAIKALRGRFALTSRPLKRLEAALPSTRFYPVTASHFDIGLLILRVVDRNPGFQRLLKEHSFKGELVRQISEKSKGMFLVAALQIEMVQHCLSILELQQALDSLPADLHDIYSQALKRINEQPKLHADLAKHVLLWLVFAREAFTFPDLQYALSLTLPDRPGGVDKEALVSICCGLVTVEAETDLVRLVHFTAQDALAPILKEYIPDPQGVLFAVAAQRLIDCGIVDNSASMKYNDDLDSALKGHPLLKYCYDHWAYHAREGMANPALHDNVLAFVRRCKSFPEKDPLYSNLKFLSPLHVVARHGFHSLLDEVLKIAGGKVTLRTRGRRKVTPLMLASEHGHVKVIDALLRYTRSSMMRSTLNGEGGLGSHLFLVQLNLRDSRGMTALMLASRGGHEDAVQRLLAHKDTQVNLADNNSRTALMFASENGHEGTVQRLLAHKDTQVNLANNNGETALMLALRYGHEGPVQRLLAHKDTQVNLTGNFGQTALMLASEYGHEGPVQRLLAHKDTQVNLANNYGSTALMYASCYGHEGTVQRLLAHKDTQVNLANNDGETALMHALNPGLSMPEWYRPHWYSQWDQKLRQKLLALFLGHSEIDANAARKDGDTALILAARDGRSEAVSLLLQHRGINVQHMNKKGETALAVARKGKLQVSPSKLEPKKLEDGTGTREDYEAIVKMLTKFERRS
ncbi:ankyrin repeat domain-containing protein 28 [Coprinopsis cinerea okayama7|uniref:Ankyrin repeat domain-containing protein 28 n=1 Tax=Coprinopsis cinerea (strain Okayama-7 / 130 / ATCC MYA-4618 / FGSC 9003) TaxID=240176 RepID=A8NAJ2_COPC7|nr:ankyrin repeat domain-containing protein 28 [Coprinopsis cinerea okayama7\|eukprot:XP_001831844.2 ankyrin repeat domain-containing protein 28 [Coprinopsis cinerea okayama7\